MDANDEMNVDQADYEANYYALTLTSWHVSNSWVTGFGFIGDWINWILDWGAAIYGIIKLFLWLILLLCLCYGCVIIKNTITHFQCPSLCSFNCLCPCLSLKRLRARFKKLNIPGQVEVNGALYTYPPTVQEQILIDRMNAMFKQDINVMEIGDGA